MQGASVSDISDRKADHVRLAIATGSEGAGHGFDAIALVHEALPELDLTAIDSGATFLGRRLDLPLCIASMTGGHRDGMTINGALARVAARHGLAMGVGSQRAALADPTLRDTYAVTRREAPSAFLMANVGAPQLVAQGGRPALTTDEVATLVEMIEADALIVHLNPLQELIQPGGDRDARGWLAAIARLASELSVPVVVKETGGGVSEGTARRLVHAGASAIDVGGRGGTSFAAIEAARAGEAGDARAAALGTTFETWGIPTAASIVLASRAGVPIIGTGGIRSGLDAAKAIALGATLVGVGRPLLQAVVAGGEAAADRWVEGFAESLRAAQFLTGSPDLSTLGRSGVILGAELRAWLSPDRSSGPGAQSWTGP
jgi:isopentenyl-diphosphate delta-isomerase